MKNSDDGVGDGGVNDPFVCDSTLVTRATAELNEEILEELSQEDCSIASVLDHLKKNPPVWASNDRGSNATDA